MIFESNKVSMTPEILKRKTGGELIVPIALTDEALADGVVKAGTAIAADGSLATTDSSSNAVGILLNDVYAENPNGALIKAFACVNSANIKENTGADVTDGVKAALNNIIFE